MVMEEGSYDSTLLTSVPCNDAVCLAEMRENLMSEINHLGKKWLNL